MINEEKAFRIGSFINRRLQTTGDIYSGGFNDNYVYLDQENCENKYLLRVPKSSSTRRHTLQNIEKEYWSVGATRKGISVQARSIPEQARFIDQLQAEGISTIDYLYADRDSMLLPFINGTPLNLFVSREKDPVNLQRTINSHLTNIFDAHKKGIIIGDRWGTNTMVLGNGSTMELDYDLKLKGKKDVLKAFELSQILYHLIHFADQNRGKVCNILESSLLLHLKDYDPKLLQYFLLGHKNYFALKFEQKGELYEEIKPPTNEIDDLIKKISPNKSIRRGADIYGYL